MRTTLTIFLLQVRGHRLVDAAVFEPVPVASAVRDGCTHVMVLCTRPPAAAPTGISKHVQRAVIHAVKNTVLYAPCECARHLSESASTKPSALHSIVPYLPWMLQKQSSMGLQTC